MWKNVASIKYTAPVLKPTTFGTRVSSHNHLTRAPAQSLHLLLKQIMSVRWLDSLYLQKFYQARGVVKTMPRSKRCLPSEQV